MSPWRAGRAPGSATRQSDASDELLDVPRALTLSIAVARGFHTALVRSRSNDSLEPTGRPTAPSRPERRPGRPAAQFRR
jgi:hypothetical protein